MQSQRCLPPGPEHEQGDEQHQREEHDDDGGGIAHVVEAERLQIQQDVQRLAGGAGSAVADDEDGVERLERIDAAYDGRCQDERPHERQGDVPEHLPGAGAVEVRGLVRIGRQAGEAAQDDQHDQGRPLPGLDQDQGGDDGIGGIHPLAGGQAHAGEQVVQHAELRVEHHGPDECHGDGGGHHGQDEDGAREAAARELPVEAHGGGDAEQHGEQDGQGGEIQGAQEGKAEALVGEHAEVVGRAGEADAAADVPVVHGHEQGEQPGEQDDGEHGGPGGHDERPVAAGVVAAGWRACGGWCCGS